MKSIAQIVEVVKREPSQRIAVAAAHDEEVLKALVEAHDKGMIEAVLVGDVRKIEKYARDLNLDLSPFELIHQPDTILAGREAVQLVRQDRADLLMKGLIGSADLLRAVLDREIGLRVGRVISHLSVLEIPDYHKLLILTDAGLNVAPDLSQKIELIRNAVDLALMLKIERPKVAVLAAAETVNPEIPATVDAAVLAKMSDRKQIKNCVIDGPLALDNAISREAAEHKGIISEVAGDSDILLAPDIEAANIVYKAFSHFTKAKMASIIAGAKVPVIFSSRADSDEIKFYSLALALYVAGQLKQRRQLPET